MEQYLRPVIERKPEFEFDLDQALEVYKLELFHVVHKGNTWGKYLWGCTCKHRFVITLLGFDQPVMVQDAPSLRKMCSLLRGAAGQRRNRLNLNREAEKAKVISKLQYL